MGVLPDGRVVGGGLEFAERKVEWEPGLCALALGAAPGLQLFRIPPSLSW